MHGTYFDTLAAGSAELLVDHVNTGLGILSDCIVLTDLCALAALNTGHRLCACALSNNFDAGQILMELLIESVGTCTDALKACHAFCTLFNSQLLHKKKFPPCLYFFFIIQDAAANIKEYLAFIIS